MEHYLPSTLIPMYQIFNTFGGRANDNTVAFLTTKPWYKGQPSWTQDIAYNSRNQLAKHAINAIMPE